MIEILDDFNLETWIKAIHDNWTSLGLLFGETSQFAVKMTPDYVTQTSDLKVAMFNRVVRSRLTVSNVDEMIQETRDYFASKDLPFVWQCYPGDTPDDLPQRLESQGFTREEGIGMAMLIEDMNTPENPEAFIFRRVITQDDMETFSRFLPKAYGMPESSHDSLAQSLMEIGIRDDFCHYVGFLDESPVACSSVLYSDGVAGIHNVATRPDTRGKGIGSMITAAPLLDAVDLGYKVTTLLSSKMGFNLYRRLGYVEYCKPVTYKWIPPS